MTVRTISDLKQASSPGLSDLFEISRLVQGNRYASQKLAYADLKDRIISSATVSCANVWNIPENADIERMESQLNALSSVIEVVTESDGRLDSVNRAKFAQAPISKGTCHDQYDVPNKAQVIELVKDNAEYITPESYVNVDPQNSYGQTQYDPQNPYAWHIDEGQTDSSKWIGTDGLSAGPVEVKETGYLVMYGWLASNSDVAAQEAWVGLYGEITVAGANSSKTDWVLLQAQPFVLGKNHQIAQYVGFNIPVRAGLKLKVMTGFKVNGEAGALGVGNRLMFGNADNAPNTFTGYVITND